MQPWPWCSFAKLREVLTRPDVGCTCELVARPGALTDLDGEPTPALYGFVREVNGEMLLAPVAAYGDDDFIPSSVLRSTCATLDLDPDVLFGNRH